ncbi:MAG: heme ABC transporter permease [Gammaproteobacteria bacterium WSBS_2016_MAG_OTU1]
MMRFIYSLASPPGFYKFSDKVRPFLWGAFVVLAAAGLYGGLVLAPADHQQGEGYRIIFVHVPAAWMSLFIYTSMAFMGAVSLVWRGKIAALCARQSAVLGASFTLITLATGSFWGKPMWGTWWAWDARLTSELILLFLYLGYIALTSSMPRRIADQAGALLLIVGVINIPVIHFSVEWWNTLHQPATITKLGAPSMHISMLRPLLFMAVAFMCFYFATMFTLAQAALLQQEKGAKWIDNIVREKSERSKQ